MVASSIGFHGDFLSFRVEKDSAAAPADP